MLQMRQYGEPISAGPYTELPVNGIKRLVNGNLLPEMNRTNFFLNKNENG